MPNKSLSSALLVALKIMDLDPRNGNAQGSRPCGYTYTLQGLAPRFHSVFASENNSTTVLRWIDQGTIADHQCASSDEQPVPRNLIPHSQEDEKNTAHPSAHLL